MLNVFGFSKKKQTEKEPSELDDSFQQMIENIYSLNKTTAKEIMVPRIDVSCVKIESKLKEIISIFKEAGYSRLPVYGKTVDDIVGIIYLKDLFNIAINGIDLENTLLETDMLREAYFIPETKKINILLKEFQAEKIHLAVVVDEYGGFSGIVSLEDILEEIVGEIQDEYDDEEDDIIKLTEDTFNCNARSDLETINSELNILLESENIDTLGGFVYNLFGKIPKINDTQSSENIDFKILKMNKNIIERILVKINEQLNKETDIENKS